MPNSSPSKPEANQWVWLGTIKPEKVSVGWGQYGVDKSWYASGFTIAGKHYKKGVFTHSQATVTYKLNDLYKTFEACVGLDDGDGNCGDGAIFKVILDKKEAYNSKVVLSANAIKCFSIPVAGKQTLELVADKNRDNKCDDAVWANARLLKK